MTDTASPLEGLVTLRPNPLNDARAQLQDAVALLGYDRGVWDLPATPRRELTVSITLRRDDDSTEPLIVHRCSTTWPGAWPTGRAVQPVYAHRARRVGVHITRPRSLWRSTRDVRPHAAGPLSVTGHRCQSTGVIT